MLQRIDLDKNHALAMAIIEGYKHLFFHDEYNMRSIGQSPEEEDPEFRVAALQLVGPDLVDFMQISGDWPDIKIPTPFGIIQFDRMNMYSKQKFDEMLVFKALPELKKYVNKEDFRACLTVVLYEFNGWKQ